MRKPFTNKHNLVPSETDKKESEQDLFFLNNVIKEVYRPLSPLLIQIMWFAKPGAILLGKPDVFFNLLNKLEQDIDGEG